MADEEWTHEMQNVLEALNEGDGSLLVRFLMDGKHLHSDLRLHIEHLLQNGSFHWTPSWPKIGRPKSGWDIWACIGLYKRKIELLSETPKRRVIDVEQQLADDYASNVEDVKKHVSKGKKELQKLAEKSDGSWARELLEIAAKK